MKPENLRIIERSYLGVKSVIGIIQIRKYPGPTSIILGI